MLRRLLRFAATGSCLLSVAACLVLGWVWWRSYQPGRNRVSLRTADARYTMVGERGRLSLLGPPPGGPPSGDHEEAYALARDLRNDDAEWVTFRFRDRDGVVWTRLLSLDLNVPGTAASRFYYDAPAGPLRRGLLAALDDPGRFAAAHLLLVLHTEPLGSLLEPGGEMGAGATPCVAEYHGLRVELRADYARSERTATDSTIYLHRGEPSVWIDPAQLPAVRDYWHARLDVTLAALPAWLAVALTATAPLLRWGSEVCRKWLHGRRARLRLCPRCGYDLRGSPSDQCSECGASRRRGG